ncbi:MAG TPA: bacillithiol biosynthesis BshC, partial [Bacteroidia bacterium]|nr:bacillithiol biosynthesis BshC [Bacteroidia bacterium]
KKQFIPRMKEELLHQSAITSVRNGIAKLEKAGYAAQVNPREINLFYMTPEFRNRIEKTEGKDEYTLVNAGLKWTQETLIAELEHYPGRFSPNVVLRPVYQQQVLPNLAYVGGPGELAYWLEYKQLFEESNLFFPVLMPRNFVMWVEEATGTRMQKLGLTVASLSKDLVEIERHYTLEHAGSRLSLDKETEHLKTVYGAVIEAAAATDATLKAPAEAELQKALNGIKNLEAKMIRSEKQRQETTLVQLRTTREKLFPEASLQERVDNFIPFYLKHGDLFLDTLKNGLDPFEQQLIVFTETGK